MVMRGSSRCSGMNPLGGLAAVNDVRPNVKTREVLHVEHTQNQIVSSERRKATGWTRALRLRCALILALAVPLCAQEPGKITERVTTAQEPNQSYAVYLPTEYTSKKRWPVLFVFDPAARGKLGAEVFRAAAEKYGYIVVGSNNSQNGPRRPQIDAFRAMLADVQQRFAVDPRRLYAAGFSGGARLAGLTCFFCEHCIRGVIACGAGLPEGLPAESRNALPPYFFTVGNADFNYFDVLDAARSLLAPRAVVTFDGSHQWPPPEVAMKALAWLDAGAMHDDVPSVAPSEVAQRKQQTELIRHISTLLGTIARESEDREQRFADARRDVGALRTKRERATTDSVIVYRRALGQAFVQAYETARGFEQAKDYGLAAGFYEVAAEAVPTNPEMFYAAASD